MKAEPQPVNDDGARGAPSNDQNAGTQDGQAVGSSAWLGRIMLVRGYSHEYNGDGDLVRKPATLSEQLRSVESSLGAHFLKEPLQVTFEPPVFD